MIPCLRFDVGARSTRHSCVEHIPCRQGRRHKKMLGGLGFSIKWARSAENFFFDAFQTVMEDFGEFDLAHWEVLWVCMK